MISQLASGKVKVHVLDGYGRIVTTTPWVRNLILNQGLDMVCSTRYWLASTTNCAVGTGTLATRESSGATAASQTGYAVSTTGGGFSFTSVANQYNMIKWASGEEAMIMSVTDAGHVTVDRSQSVASGLFIVYRTNQVGLATETKRHTAYLVGPASCYTYTQPAQGIVTSRRTYNFSVESSPATYTELGFSYASAPGNNLFSRILLATPVTVAAGQYLQVIYDLSIAQAPCTATAKTASITGWPTGPATDTTGYEQCESWGLAGVNSAGAVAPISTVPDTSAHGVYVLEPSHISLAYLTNAASGLALFPNGAFVHGTTGAPTVNVGLNSYTPLDFYRTKTAFFDTINAAGADLQSAGLGVAGSGTNLWSGYRFRFNQAQIKSSFDTITLVYKISVGRVLS